MNIVFQTPRLILRQLTVEDAALILELNCDPEVVKYLHEPTLHNIADAEKIITDIILPQYKNKLGRWAIHTKEDMQFIGWCGLKHRPERDEIDLGYRLKQQAWGKGFATEAAKHTLDYGFMALRLTKITACAHIENATSYKILEKIGMKYSGEGIVDDCPVRTYTMSNPNL